MNEAERVIRRIHQGITDKMHSKDNGTCWSAVLGHQLFITKDGKEAGLNYNDSNLNLFEKCLTMLQDVLQTDYINLKNSFQHVQKSVQSIRKTCILALTVSTDVRKRRNMFVI